MRYVSKGFCGDQAAMRKLKSNSFPVLQTGVCRLCFSIFDVISISVSLCNHSFVYSDLGVPSFIPFMSFVHYFSYSFFRSFFFGHYCNRPHEPPASQIGPIFAGNSVQAERGGNGNGGNMLLLGHQLLGVMPSQHGTMEARGFILAVRPKQEISLETIRIQAKSLS